MKTWIVFTVIVFTLGMIVGLAFGSLVSPLASDLQGPDAAVVAAPETLEDQALAAYKKELERFFVKCDDSWFTRYNGYAYGTSAPNIWEVRELTFSVHWTSDLTPADRANGFEWHGGLGLDNPTIARQWLDEEDSWYSWVSLDSVQWAHLVDAYASKVNGKWTIELDAYGNLETIVPPGD